MGVAGGSMVFENRACNTHAIRSAIRRHGAASSTGEIIAPGSAAVVVDDAKRGLLLVQMVSMRTSTMCLSAHRKPPRERRVGSSWRRVRHRARKVIHIVRRCTATGPRASGFSGIQSIRSAVLTDHFGLVLFSGSSQNRRGSSMISHYCTCPRPGRFPDQHRRSGCRTAGRCSKHRIVIGVRVSVTSSCQHFAPRQTSCWRGARQTIRHGSVAGADTFHKSATRHGRDAG